MSIRNRRRKKGDYFVGTSEKAKDRSLILKKFEESMLVKIGMFCFTILRMVGPTLCFVGLCVFFFITESMYVWFYSLILFPR